MNKRFLIAILLIVMTIMCCFLFRQEKNVTRAFYYWKSVYSISDQEELMLDSIGVTKLYVKYFDVDWDEKESEPIPVATINFPDNINSKREFVPVIYITNKVVLNISTDKINDFADKIAKRIEGINKQYRISIKEIQLDCDWTDKSKASYFSLIEQLRKCFPKEKFILSATIRLHQVKFKNRTGVPSVDRGMLMFYNMGMLESMDTSNSVFNADVAGKYLDEISNYPLPLDVALPVFTWGIHRRGNHIESLVNNLSTEEVSDKGLFKQLRSNIWVADTGFFFRGEYFMRGDVLKMEEVTPELAKEAVDLILPELKSNNFSVAFYHFDSTNTKRYEIKDFETMYHCFE